MRLAVNVATMTVATVVVMVAAAGEIIGVAGEDGTCVAGSTGKFPWETMRSAAPSSSSSVFGMDDTATGAVDGFVNERNGGRHGSLVRQRAYADLFGLSSGASSTNEGEGGGEGGKGKAHDVYYADTYGTGASEKISTLLRPAMFEDALLSRITTVKTAPDAYFPNINLEKSDGTRVAVASLLSTTPMATTNTEPGQWRTFTDPRAVFASMADVTPISARVPPQGNLPPRPVSVSAVKGSCAVRCERAVGRQSCVERCECQQLCLDAKEVDRCHRRCLQDRRGSAEHTNADGTQRVDAVGFVQRYRCYTCLNGCVVASPTPSSAYTCQVSTCASQCDRESVAWDSTSPCRTNCLTNKEDYIGCITACGDF